MKKLILSSLLLLASSIFANEVKIVKVKALCDENKICRFDVTLQHEDKGWEHFANKWEIYTPDNKLIATRTLFHPHVKEQPFTRSLAKVKIPTDLKTVIIKAHDNVHGYSSQIFEYNFK